MKLHGDPDRLGVRVAVLVYPRDRDIHRVDLIGADGAIVNEQVSHDELGRERW